ncbi:histidine phosphatase family protein [Nonomuraea cavernae]|uniref:histidine phosphatase family protein n=1 Tax=Nonomuraea cavernae TaxID=2045107 RepID=UPI0034058B5F
MEAVLSLIRHGQTQCTVEGRFCGGHEGELTGIGQETGVYAGRHPALEDVGLVVSSPSRRALLTAEKIAAAKAAHLVVDDRLSELSFGEWEDRLPSEVDRHSLRRWESDPALFSPPGGETGLEVMARSVAAVRDAAQRARSVAVVTHKAPIRLVLSFFLGLPPSRYRELGGITVGSVTRLELRGGRATLTALGDVSHLPPAWRSDTHRG